jgi:hypothetical protein
MTDKPIAPRFTGKTRELTITGYILPLREGQPVFVNVPGMEAATIAIFSTHAALKLAEKQVPGFSYDRLMVIENGREFLQPIPSDGTVEIIIDPVIEDGKTRFQKLFRD